MAKKNSLLRVKDIRAGKTVWFVYLGTVKQVTIHRIRHEKYGKFIHGSTHDLFDVYSLSDRGVIGTAYDERPCQIFRTKKAAHFWNNKWTAMGVNPNCLVKNRYGN